jgi:hypothetical protein
MPPEKYCVRESVKVPQASPREKGCPEECSQNCDSSLQRHTLAFESQSRLALLHRLFQFFLVIRKQSMNLVVRFVPDPVNLRSQLLPRSFRILIEQRLNLIVVLLKQRPDLPLLFRSQLQIFRKASKFLVDRLRRMDMLKLLTR